LAAIPALIRRGLAVAVAAMALAVGVRAGPALAGPTTTIDPGRLAQTSTEPSTGAGLRAQLDVLWRALLAGNSTLARTVFFPRSAYLRMKRGLVPNPGGDYSSRLIALYDLDVGAYHRLLAGRPALVAVRAARADAAWIAPGACENLIGYWHLPGVRLVYRKGANVRSVAIDSLISWRGVWYVVHLGPNPRPTNVGTLDDPRRGPGTPGPAGGC
jgi:hypothetical protein